jgi:uncharacterized protein YbbK (DUF523 family)
MSRPRRVLVSACLLGVACRYDGAHKRYPGVRAALEGFEVVPVCPEQAGGLSTPRVPCDLCGGDGHAVWARRASVIDREGADRSAAFREGARRCLQQAPDAAWALLKSGSPSCGVRRTWIDGQRVPGCGVFAALLAKRGIPARTEEQLQQPAEGA